MVDDLDGLSVLYINQEGAEIPLRSIKDFEAAFKSEKWKGRDHLNLVFYDEKLKACGGIGLNSNRCGIIGRFLKRQKDAMPCNNTNFSDASLSVEEPLPEWFKHYMKKFKQDLLKDLKSDISQMVHEEFEKKKLAETKLCAPLFEKNELPQLPRLKKKKKISDRDNLDVLEKREMKLLKKIEKLHSSKYDRPIYPVLYLDKLANKARALLEEKRKLLERGRQSKLRDPKIICEVGKKYMKNEKSALFRDNNVTLTLQPGEKFSLTVNILNNGTVPWISPRMECLNEGQFCSEELDVIDLPRLGPGQSVNVRFRGRVKQKLGNFVIRYKLFDGPEEFGPQFTCFIVVSDSKEKIVPHSSGESNHESRIGPVSEDLCKKDLRSSLIDFDKDVIRSSQKKIKENITEIERKLQVIDSFRPCPSGEGTKEMNSPPHHFTHGGGGFQVRGCDLPQGKETNCWVEKCEKHILFGVDFLQQKETENSKQKDENVKSETFQGKANGVESDSDSELSVILMSEEDENFIFVTTHTESSESDSLIEMKIPAVDLNKESNEANKESNEAVVEEPPIKLEHGEVEREKVSSTEDFLCSQSQATTTDVESRGSATSSKSSTENVPGDEPPRKFENRDFPSENTLLRESNNSPVFPYSTGEPSISKNTNIGGENEQNFPPLVFYSREEFSPPLDEKKDHSEKSIPTMNRYGKPIYAVREDGRCLSVERLTENVVEVPVETGESRQETQSGTKEETLGNQTANENLFHGPSGTIPNVLASSASSVASMAFNTAKFVINNLQSALKLEAEIRRRDSTENRRETEHENSSLNNIFCLTPEEREYLKTLGNQEKYLDAVLTLREMGFVNHELNFQLLKKYNNQVYRVICEILENAPVDTTTKAE